MGPRDLSERLASTTVSSASLVAFQTALAPRDLERDEAVMRWLYVYATGACLQARRMGEQLGRVSEGGLFRYPASMSWDPTRALAQATLPEGGGVRYWPTSDTSLSDNAIDIVVGPVDTSRIDRAFNGAEPFQDLLNVLVQGKV